MATFRINKFATLTIKLLILQKQGLRVLTSCLESKLKM